MSGGIFRRNSGRNSRNQSSGNAALEANLGQLGFLVEPKSKKSKSEGSRSAGASHHRRGPSRDSSRSTAPEYPSTKPSASRQNRSMASSIDGESSRRKDKTFLGGECAVCEEQLELTLRGERILQLSCGHIAHEACFYEYLREFDSHSCPICNAPLSLDSSRGGAVPNIDILSNAVRHVAPSKNSSYAQSVNTQLPWDERGTADTAPPSQPPPPASSPPPRQQEREIAYHSRNRSLGAIAERVVPSSEPGHSRNVSTSQSYAPQEYAEPQSVQRRHDYDVQSMESSLTSPRVPNPNVIPPPIVTVRSEFPTMTKSRQQQSLTCLVTIEVGEPKMRATPVDMGAMRPNTHRSGSEYSGMRSPIAPFSRPPQEPVEDLEKITEELQGRVEKWHGLDFSKFGRLRLHGHMRVGKDRRNWQDLDCYLFTDMLICVKDRKPPSSPQSPSPEFEPKKPKCTLKGSILIKKHFKDVQATPEENLLTLTLSVTELPIFYLQFRIRAQMELWKTALQNIHDPNPPLPPQIPVPSRGHGPPPHHEYDVDHSGEDDDEYKTNPAQRLSSVNSSIGAAKSYQTAPTEYSNPRGAAGGFGSARFPQTIRVPLDIVVVIPVSAAMQALKITVLKDSLRFLVSNLGERDRMGLVTFGSSPGGVPVVQMTGRSWNGWNRTLESIRPIGQKNFRADVVEGANVAMDLLMQRQYANPLASILLISDSSTSDAESVDFVVQRAEAAKVVIHSFGLGSTHKPDTLLELSSRTKASYTYVKDWMMLRECLAGVFGSLHSTSHQNVKLKLRLPEGSPAKFVKISGALHYTKRATGRDAEAALGDLRFGDKRDILVQLAIAPAETNTAEQAPHDPWESIVSNLEALGGSLDQDETRTLSVEEVPLLQADLIFNDLQREGQVAQLPRQTLLTITMLPANPRVKSSSQTGPIPRPNSPPIPSHPLVQQRRMELLTSDMMGRALMLVSKGQHDRAQHLLTETRSLLKGLGKGSLPPLPPPGAASSSRGPTNSSGSLVPTSPTSTVGTGNTITGAENVTDKSETTANQRRTPSPPQSLPPTSPAAVSTMSMPPMPTLPQSTAIDSRTLSALETELDSSLEWIAHPAVFNRDSRKAVLQAMGVITSQRGYTFRTPIESLWAEKVTGIKKMTERAAEWREVANQQGLGDAPSTVVEE